jgi:exodeoxyribonuclease VII large subunit
VQRQRLESVAGRLQPGVARGLERAAERLGALAKLYASVDPERPLQRGFARVTRADGSIVHAGAALASGEEVAIKFGDKVTRQAVIDGAGSAPAVAKPVRAKPKAPSPPQGDLF